MAICEQNPKHLFLTVSFNFVFLGTSSLPSMCRFYLSFLPFTSFLLFLLLSSLSFSPASCLAGSCVFRFSYPASSALHGQTSLRVRVLTIPDIWDGTSSLPPDIPLYSLYYALLPLNCCYLVRYLLLRLLCKLSGLLSIACSLFIFSTPRTIAYRICLINVNRLGYCISMPTDTFDRWANLSIYTHCLDQ